MKCALVHLNCTSRQSLGSIFMGGQKIVLMKIVWMLSPWYFYCYFLSIYHILFWSRRVLRNLTVHFPPPYGAHFFIPPWLWPQNSTNPSSFLFCLLILKLPTTNANHGIPSPLFSVRFQLGWWIENEQKKEKRNRCCWIPLNISFTPSFLWPSDPLTMQKEKEEERTMDSYQGWPKF